MVIEEEKIRKHMWEPFKYSYDSETKCGSFTASYIRINPLAPASLRYMFYNDEWVVVKDGKKLKSNYPISFMGSNSDSVVRQAWKKFLKVREYIEEWARDPWPELTAYQEHKKTERYVYPRYVDPALIPYAPYNEMWRNGPLPERRYYGNSWSWIKYTDKFNKGKDKYKLVIPAHIDTYLVYLENGESELRPCYVKPHFKGSRKLNWSHNPETRIEYRRYKDISNLLDNDLVPTNKRMCRNFKLYGRRILNRYFKEQNDEGL